MDTLLQKSGGESTPTTWLAEHVIPQNHKKLTPIVYLGVNARKSD